ncbi:ATP-binding protein [Patescibacteria group bacterium]
MEEFIGNPQIIKLFSSLQKEDLNHAYLFYGKEGIGKFKLAKILAQSLQCPDGKILTPCKKCPTCISANLETITLKGTEKISIDEIRKIQKKMNLKSQNNSFKICIIDNAERLTQEASNCLLKILEEPPEKTIFILTTPKKELIFSTIRSRCQKIKFLPVSKDLLEKELKKLDPKKAITSEIINYADGAPGKAIKLLENQGFAAELEEQKKLLDQFLKGSIAKRFQITTELSKSTYPEIKHTLEQWFSILNLDLKEAKNSSPQKWETKDKNIIIFLKLLLEIKQKTDYNLNKRILLDQLVIRGPELT